MRLPKSNSMNFYKSNKKLSSRGPEEVPNTGCSEVTPLDLGDSSVVLGTHGWLQGGPTFWFRNLNQLSSLNFNLKLG